MHLSTTKNVRSISDVLYFFYHRRIARRKSIQQSTRCTLSLRRFFKQKRSLVLIQVKVHSKLWNELWICEMKPRFVDLFQELDCWYSIWSLKSWNIAFPSDGTSHDCGTIADLHTALLSITRLPRLFMLLGGRRAFVNVKCVYSSPRTQRNNTI